MRIAMTVLALIMSAGCEETIDTRPPPLPDRAPALTLDPPDAAPDAPDAAPEPTPDVGADAAADGGPDIE